MGLKGERERTPKSQEVPRKRSAVDSEAPRKKAKAADLPLQLQTLTPLQAKCIPLALQGRDLLVAADPGQGSRMAFLQPAVAHLLRSSFSREDGTGVVVLAANREMALQTKAIAKEVLGAHPLTCGVVMDGTSQKGEEARLAKHINVLIATPDRLLAHIHSSVGFRYQKVSFLVIDNADLILKQNLQLQAVLQALPSARQTLLFTRSLTPEVEELSAQVLKTPERVVMVADAPQVPKGWQQGYTVVEPDKKFLLLCSFLRRNLDKKIIVFLSTSAGVKYFSALLPALDFPVQGIHGMQKTEKREAVWSAFNAAQAGVLLCTDLVAQSAPLPAGVQWVVHYDPPQDASFLTRVCSTPRAAVQAKTLMFLLPNERTFLARFTQVDTFEYRFQQNKLVNIQSHYERLLDKNYKLHVAAKAAHRAYVLAYAQADKDLFDVNQLDLMKVGKAFGFPVAPRVTFSQSTARPASTE